MFPHVTSVPSPLPHSIARYGKAFRRLALRSRLIGSGAVLAICATSAPQLALAADECGVGTEVTCTAAGNTYPNGIAYTSAGDQTVHLQSGVAVDALTPNTGLFVSTSNPTGAITIDGPSGVSITTEGDGATGVLLQSLDGPVTANIATVATKGINAEGVNADFGSGPVTLTIGSVSTIGSGSIGIDAGSGSGTVTVSVNSVSTKGDGAIGILTSAGSGVTSITAGSVATTGVGADGIVALGGAPTAAIGISTTGAVTTTGDGAIGILASTPGNIAITTAGNVSTAGVNAPAIQAASGSGSVTLNATGGVISASKSVAVDLTGNTVTATIGSKATVSGGTAGISLTSVTGATLNQNGAVSAASGFAVEAFGGPATINNAGTITGAVALTPGADVVNNSGTFNATTDSDFGAGADVFNNTGTVNVLPTATKAGSVTFTGLETFNNKGTVSLVNGHTGDVLNLPGTFNGGTGSTLAVDFAGGQTPAADTLAVAGAATGATAVRLNSVNGGLLTNGVVIASGGAGSAPGAFTVSPASANIGFVGYQVVFDAGSNTYSLVGTPDAAVYEVLKVEELITNLARQSEDAFSSHMAQARDAHWAGAGWQGFHGWGQLYGGAQDRKDGRTVTNFGVTQSFNLTYDSNYYGFQGGVDAATGPWIFGLTAGYGGADQHFLATADKTQIQGYNVGAYAGVMTGGLFVTVLGKYNGDQIQMGSIAPASVINFSAHTYSGKVEAGYRLGTDVFFVEPVVSFDYLRTLVDNFAALDSTFNFRRHISEQLNGGFRFGMTVGEFYGAKVVPYGAIMAVKEYKGQDGFLFSNGGFDFNFLNSRRGGYGHATAGLNLLSSRGVDGYLQGDLDFARGASGGGARVGVRFAF